MAEPAALAATFRQLSGQGRKALIVYLTAGYPSLRDTVELVPALADAGADIVELGVPFSDPVADGVTIQRASAAALRAGVHLPEILDAVAAIRRRSRVPVILMGYYNPVLAYGPGRFVDRCREVGVDGLIVPDLPPGEAAPLLVPARRAGIGLVFLLAPNSPPDRIRLVSRLSDPFIYYVSVTGVTGARRSLPRGVRARIAEIRRYTGKPVCLGFGISAPAQAARLAGCADGVIVGSALLQVMEKAGSRFQEAALDFVRSFAAVLGPDRVPVRGAR